MSDTPPSREETARRIRNLRRSKDMSIQTLAERSKISPGHLSEVERAQSAISGEKLARIAAALEVTPDYFLSAESAPSQSTAIQIPRGLAHAAEALDLTYAKTIRLLAGKDSLVARRSGSEEQEWSREDWIEFYKKVEPYL